MGLSIELQFCKQYNLITTYLFNLIFYQSSILTPILVFVFFTSIIFEGGGTTIKSCLGDIWPAAALIKMIPRSAFEEIS